MKTFTVHHIGTAAPITVIAETCVWTDGTVDFYTEGGETVAEFQRRNVVGVVCVVDEQKGSLQ